MSGPIGARLTYAGEFPSDGTESCIAADPELFFPQKGASAAAAKAVCDGCPREFDCLMFAVEHHQSGVWGGMSERERRAFARDLNANKADPDGQAVAS